MAKLVSDYESRKQTVSQLGFANLHRLETSAHVSFTKVEIASIHNVGDFLDKSDRSPFVASSYSTHRQVSAQLDKKLSNSQNEDKWFARRMPVKIITICENEIFHPEICLVVIEPVYNFILVERYKVNRETQTLNEAVSDTLENLPVEVIQVASDLGEQLSSVLFNFQTGFRFFL